MTAFMTIERHILDKQRQHPNASGSLTQLLYDIALAAKIIARETTRAGLVNILGSHGSVNVQGEEQMKLDVFADQTLYKMNDHTGRVCLMASEEHEDIIPIPNHFPVGNYVLVYDPLDGSGNVDVNASMGTIFAIHRKISSSPRGVLEDVLQKGRDIVAAGYIVYGPSTMMVYSVGDGVHGFTLDPSVGEFLLSHESIRIPQTPRFYGCNQGNERYWTEGVRRYLNWVRATDDPHRKPLDGRYMGALVADFHRILLKGGVYIYPGDLRDPLKPAGKLRLLYECAPLSYLMEQAGGYGSDGYDNILEIQPHQLHQRTPLFIGDKVLVQKAESLIHEHDQEWLRAYIPYRNGQHLSEKNDH
ncbi:MAG: class 1 fructose-bisphosphatase [Anaerolineae bacterium]|nr:class 1 fructose-bisphosphatase [Anaerolineae bacterium]